MAANTLPLSLLFVSLTRVSLIESSLSSSTASSESSTSSSCTIVESTLSSSSQFVFKSLFVSIAQDDHEIKNGINPSIHFYIVTVPSCNVLKHNNFNIIMIIHTT